MKIAKGKYLQINNLLYNKVSINPKLSLNIFSIDQ